MQTSYSLRYGAGPSFGTANLGAEIALSFSVPAHRHVCYPLVYQQPLRCFCALTLARLVGLTDRVEVHEFGFTSSSDQFSLWAVTGSSKVGNIPNSL